MVGYPLVMLTPQLKPFPRSHRIADIWKAQRKWAHAAMAEAYKHHFYGHVELEMKRYLGLLLLDPARFLDYTREYCGRVMSRLAWDDATQGRTNGDSADTTLHCM